MDEILSFVTRLSPLSKNRYPSCLAEDDVRMRHLRRLTSPTCQRLSLLFLLYILRAPKPNRRFIADPNEVYRLLVWV